MKQNRFNRSLYLTLCFLYTPCVYGILVINQPGQFNIGGDVLELTGDIIQISTNNVVLDLGNHTLSGGSRGIIIDNNLFNIDVINGTILGVAGDGLVIGQNCSGITIDTVSVISAGGNGITVNSGCQGIFLNNNFITSITGIGFLIRENVIGLRAVGFNIFGCGNSALQCNGTALLSNDNILLENIVTASCSLLPSSTCVIAINYGDDVYMRNCIFNSGGTTISPLSVLRISNTSEFILENSSLINNQAGGTGLIGIDVVASSSCLFQDIILSSNMALTGTCVGVSLSGNSSSNSFENIKILAASAPASTCYGFYLQPGSASNYINNCQITNLGGVNTYGIQFLGSGTPSSTIANTIINSSIIRNVATTGEAIGIDINRADQSTVQECVISDNRSVSGLCVGLRFNSSTGGNNWNINSNNITRNNGNGNGNSFGIRVHTGSTNNLFLKNFSYNNGTTSANQLSGLPNGSVTPINSLSLATPTAPWTNLTIVP